MTCRLPGSPTAEYARFVEFELRRVLGFPDRDAAIADTSREVGVVAQPIMNAVDDVQSLLRG